MARSSSCRSLPLALLALLFTLATVASARPTLPLSNKAASFEPLLERAAPQVGPQRSLERLRLRRRAVDLRSTAPVDGSVSNPKLAARSKNGVSHPKAKRGDVLNVVRVWNPKAKRSVVSQPPRRRNVLTFLSNLVGLNKRAPLHNPKSKRSSTSSNTIRNPKRSTIAAVKSCKKTADCNILLPDNSHQFCYRNVCTFGCNKGYAKAAVGSSCIRVDSAESTPKCPTCVTTTTVVNTVTATAPVTTKPPTSAPGFSQTCKQTTDCNIFLPDNAHQKCERGHCVIGCNTNFAINNFGSLCIRTQLGAPSSTIAVIVTKSSSVRATTTTVASTTLPSPATTTRATTTIMPTATTGACRRTSDCNIALPDYSHQHCLNGQCVIGCDKGHTLNSAGNACPASAATTSSSVAKPTSWPTGEFISSAYYTDWSGDLLPPSAVDMSMFDLIFFAFAVPTQDYNVQFLQDNSLALLSELVQYAHGNNTKVVVSIGGWTDSTYFSAAVQTSANRATFVANIAAMVASTGVDGVDIDWEYPGGGGASGNIVNSADTANFLKFLTALRNAIGNDKEISTCTTQQPFIGADGSPLTDVGAFANVIDRILVMNYDVWGASSTPGPNAPLSNVCPNSNQPGANELSAIQTWTAAGMPASKILMGVPSYGYISSSSATTLIHKRDLVVDSAKRSMSNRERASIAHSESQRSPMHRSFIEGKAKRAQRDLAKRAIKRVERKAVADQLQKRGKILICPNNHSGQPCGGEIANQTIKTINWNPLNGTSNSNNGTSTNGVFNGGGVGIGKLGNGDLGTIDGNQIEFYQLISYGVITQKSAKTPATYNSVNGYVSAWDKCSSTPYMYNSARQVVITYDNPYSLSLKGALAASQKIAGIGMWDMVGDTADWDLVKGFRSGMGLPV